MEQLTVRINTTNRGDRPISRLLRCIYTGCECRKWKPICHQPIAIVGRFPLGDFSIFRILNMFKRGSLQADTESVVESADSVVESCGYEPLGGASKFHRLHEQRGYFH